MKKILSLLFLGFAAIGFAETIVLDNQTGYPMKNAKIAIQWANSGREVDAGNQALIAGKLNPAALEFLSQAGKIAVTLPQKAEYFRILVWSKGKTEPDLHTNWVDAVPSKSYVLKGEHLVPCVLIMGSGC